MKAENTCSRCGQDFHVWSEYHMHITPMRCARVIRPINTSGRSKAQIIEDAERTWLMPYLVTNVISKGLQNEKTNGIDLADIMWADTPGSSRVG